MTGKRKVLHLFPRALVTAIYEKLKNLAEKAAETNSWVPKRGS